MKNLLLLPFLLACSYSTEPVVAAHIPEVKEVPSTPKDKPTANAPEPEAAPYQAKRHALIIANGNYQAGTGWPSISSLNDVGLLRKVLLIKGFPPSQITVLRDASYADMVKALQNFEQSLDSGDVAFVHYSGHGQQIEDDNGDEPDGYDEALVPVDAPLAYVEGVYEGERHLRDDALGEATARMRKRLTSAGNLFLTVDACHSGTAIRGFALARGTDRPFARPGFTGAFQSENRKDEWVAAYRDQAPFTAFYASSPHEINYEYPISADSSVGSLSYALSEALLQAQVHTTYSGLFDKLRLTMAAIAPNQTPITEGTLNQGILGGMLTEGPLYFEVSRAVTDKGVLYATLGTGLLAGVCPGSIVNLYPSSQWDLGNREPLATGRVVFAGALMAVVQVDKKVSEDEVLQSRAVVVQKGFGEMLVKIGMDISDKALVRELTARLDTRPFLKISGVNPDLLLRQLADSSLELMSRGGHNVWRGDGRSGAGTTAQAVLNIAEEYAKAQCLRNLCLEEPALNTSFEFVPYQAKIIGGTLVGASPVSKEITGTWTFKEGDYFKLKVENHGSKPVYYTLLDIQPDCKISVLIPGAQYHPTDFRLAPGQSYLSDLMVIGPPYGTEVFKLIASEQPMDLRPALESRNGEKAVPGAVEDSPLTSFFSRFTGTDQGIRGVNTVAPGAVHIYSKAFTITKN